MKNSFLILSALILAPISVFALENGDAAPDFSLRTADGKTVSLSDFKGKTVVLEWTNPACPFVKKFYGVGAMQDFQKDAIKKEVVWLSINSTHSEHQDYLNPEQTKAWLAKNGVASQWLLDSTGRVGKAYNATRTPHMFIVNADGILVYQGAIDSERNADSESIAGAENYVINALAALSMGSEIEETETRPYGCGIKY